MPNSVFIGPFGFINNGTQIIFPLPGAFPDGSAAAPSITFASAPNTGIYAAGVGTVSVTASANHIVDFTSGSLDIVKDSGQLRFGSNADAVIARDAANTLALRNGVNAQLFNIYNTFTDVSNYERAILAWSGNKFFIASQKAGSGTARNLQIQSASALELAVNASGTAVLTIDTSGDLISGVGSYIEGIEMTAPTAGAANTGRLFYQDNGSGKTQLMVIFASGAAQQIAIQP